MSLYWRSFLKNNTFVCFSKIDSKNVSVSLCVDCCPRNYKNSNYKWKFKRIIRASKVLFLLVTEVDLEFELKQTKKRNDLYIHASSVSLSPFVCGCVWFFFSFFFLFIFYFLQSWVRLSCSILQSQRRLCDIDLDWSRPSRLSTFLSLWARPTWDNKIDAL